MVHIQGHFNHISNLIKNLGDGAAVGSVILAVLDILNPVAQLILGILTIIWFYFRIKDMILSNKIKQKELDKK